MRNTFIIYNTGIVQNYAKSLYIYPLLWIILSMVLLALKVLFIKDGIIVAGIYMMGCGLIAKVFGKNSPYRFSINARGDDLPIKARFSYKGKTIKGALKEISMSNSNIIHRVNKGGVEKTLEVPVDTIGINIASELTKINEDYIDNLQRLSEITEKSGYKTKIKSIDGESKFKLVHLFFGTSPSYDKYMGFLGVLNLLIVAFLILVE